MPSAGIRLCEHPSPGAVWCEAVHAYRRHFTSSRARDFYTGRGDLDWVRRRARADKADEAQADEEEQGEGYAQDEGTIRVRAGGDEAGCRPEAHEDGRAVSAQGVG